MKALTPWEIAKPLLEQDYINGKANDDMPPRQVVQLRAEYEAVPYKNFCINWLARKRAQETGRGKHAESDRWRECPNPWFGFLQTCKGYNWLLGVIGGKDSASGWHQSWSSLVDKTQGIETISRRYQEFSLKDFRNHIHQETRKQLESNYWLIKKRKKELKKATTSKPGKEA